MSVQSEITRINNNVQSTLSTIASTGVEVPAGANSDSMPSLVSELANTKQNTLTGTSGQVVGFNADGAAEAQNPADLMVYTAASTDGVTYTATIPWLVELAAGQMFTIVPDMTSTTTNTKLNVNGLGDKYLRRPLTTNNSATTTGYSDGWIIKDKPVLVMYDGTYFKTVTILAPDANTIYGTVKVENGGTGGVTAEAALGNLGGMAAATYDPQGKKQDIFAYVDDAIDSVSKSTVISTTLTASGWVNGAYILTVDGVTVSSNQEILPAVGITAEQLEALQSANVQDGGQTAGNITLKAYGEVPTIDIPIRVIKRGD